MDGPVLAAERLSKRFGPVRALDEATLEVPEGAVFGLLGPNGSGKTTLLRCALGLVRPTAGRAFLFGTEAWDADPGLRRAVGAIVEGPGLVGGLPAEANLRRHAALLGMRGAEAVAAVSAALDSDDLRRLGATPARRLSRGERQRVALAAAFLGSPRLLVLDEPTEGLDPLAIAGLRARLEAAHRGGATVVLSSHLLSEVERLATHAAVLAGGRVRAAGAVEALRGATAPRLRIRGNPAARAAEVLAAAGVPAAPSGEDGVLLAEAPPEAAPALVAALVRAGVEVSEVAPVRTGLEEIYRAALARREAA
ncbi:MAG: ABC transporter ATP-binding protein [Planctomycetales bacterium]|nr:ABC transporter ATP-binding protein [Planctomycetales bacterium]